ncbi:hypothetical protein HMPREF3198_02042 [Winkia neuii]|nr:hypothetical protein HMPREF3198_02042 [Winkia neuii]
MQRNLPRAVKVKSEVSVGGRSLPGALAVAKSGKCPGEGVK